MAIERKIFPIEDFKSEKTDTGYYVSGYANTKNKEDAYGDIPTNFNDKKVYDLKRYKLNPILLVDHNNSAAWIAGVVTSIKEDDVGLKFKAKMMDDAPNPPIKHAIEAFKQGFGRAISIGGIWMHEDPDNPKHLTRAIIHDTSIVGIGADSTALTDTPKPKKLTEGSQEEDILQKELKNLIFSFRNNPFEKKIIQEIAELREKILIVRSK